MQEIKIEEYKKEMENKEYDTIFKTIVEKTMELVKKISQDKGMEVPKINIYDERTFDEIDEIFKSNSIYFGSIEGLMGVFSRWEDDFLGDSKEEKIKICIRLYNESLRRLEEYNVVKQEINEKGYENLKKEKTDKIIGLFKEMLKYKNKNYDDNWDFSDWLNCISEKYNYFHNEIVDLYDIYYYGHVDRYMDGEAVVEVDRVEEILNYEASYTWLESEYKDHAYDYIDIELKEGQTYKDIYNEEKEKLVKLFKEMLDYINERYEKETFDSLRIDVGKKYPWYYERIHFLYQLMGMTGGTYIELIDDMEKLYNFLSKDYKNIEENKKKYKEQKKKEKIEIDMDPFDYEGLLMDDDFDDDE